MSFGFNGKIRRVRIRERHNPTFKVLDFGDLDFGSFEELDLETPLLEKICVNDVDQAVEKFFDASFKELFHDCSGDQIVNIPDPVFKHCKIMI